MVMAACHSYKQLFYLLITAAPLSHGSQNVCSLVVLHLRDKWFIIAF